MINKSYIYIYKFTIKSNDVNNTDSQIHNSAIAIILELNVNSYTDKIRIPI